MLVLYQRIEYDNVIRQYTYTKPVKHKEVISVVGDITFKMVCQFKSNNTCADINIISKEYGVLKNK